MANYVCMYVSDLGFNPWLKFSEEYYCILPSLLSWNLIQMKVSMKYYYEMVLNIRIWRWYMHITSNYNPSVRIINLVSSVVGPTV